MDPRGIRNNNPGNIDFLSQPYAVKEPRTFQVPRPRFAKFDTMDHGLQALAKQIQLYFSRGINTTAKIIHTWAPPTENHTGDYADFVAGKMGVPVNAVISCDVPTVSKLAMAISTYECGNNLPFTIADVQKNVAVALGDTLV